VGSPYHAARAADVFNDHLLAQKLSQARRQVAPDLIRAWGASARRLPTLSQDRKSILSVRYDHRPQSKSADYLLCRLLRSMQDLVDVGPINAVLLRLRCLASSFLDLHPEQFDNVVPFKNAHAPHL
jgi:hypothetical protein